MAGAATTDLNKMALQAFVWNMCVVQIILFTTKITEDTKGSND
jgi:hypothetical protein